MFPIQDEVVPCGGAWQSLPWGPGHMYPLLLEDKRPEMFQKTGYFQTQSPDGIVPVETLNQDSGRGVSHFMGWPSVSAHVNAEILSKDE